MTITFWDLQKKHPKRCRRYKELNRKSMAKAIYNLSNSYIKHQLKKKGVINPTYEIILKEKIRLQLFRMSHGRKFANELENGIKR